MDFPTRPNRQHPASHWSTSPAPRPRALPPSTRTRFLLLGIREEATDEDEDEDEGRRRQRRRRRGGEEAGDEASRRAFFSSPRGGSRTPPRLLALPRSGRVALRAWGERGSGRRERNGGTREGRGGASLRRLLPLPAVSRGGDRRVWFPIGSAFDSFRWFKCFEILILFIPRPLQNAQILMP